jgi:hypothetical protein
MTSDNKNLERKEEEKATPLPPLISPLSKGSQLVSFGDRITYIFAYGKEVGSIHFDRGRKEIFYKGHNIRNMELEDWQMQVMEKLRNVLQESENGKEFVSSYSQTLDKILLEKKHTNPL